MSYLLRRLAPTLALAALLQGCGGNTDVEAAEVGPLPQGIFGTVTRATGDFFCCPSHGKVEDLAVPVHIIRGQVATDAERTPPALADLPLEVSVQSTVNGTFGAGLTPGTYTVFAEIDGALYRGSFDHAGAQEIYGATEVPAGLFVKVDIDDDSGATY